MYRWLAGTFSWPKPNKRTTVECYTNVGSFGEGGHDEAVRHIREKCPIHLDIVCDYVLSSRL